MKPRLTIVILVLVVPILLLAQAGQPAQKAASPSNAAQPWQLKMTAPLEVGIVCVDLDRMLKFYTEVVGLKKVADAETPPEMSKLARSAPNGYRIVRMQTPYGERIKLIQPKVESPKRAPVPKWAFLRAGVAFTTFLVDDMDAVVTQLRANKVKLVSENAIQVRPGVFALLALDPEGNYVEFVRYPDISAYRPDLVKK
jgi:catechol 2,3-dioxygenase-like lactoylglutathione lyase family enzyme